MNPHIEFANRRRTPLITMFFGSLGIVGTLVVLAIVLGVVRLLLWWSA